MKLSLTWEGHNFSKPDDKPWLDTAEPGIALIPSSVLSRAAFSSWCTLFFFIQEVNAILVWGWLLGYKCINFLRGRKVKTNTGSCKNLCSWLTESGHCCHPVLLSLLSQVVTDPPRHEVAAVCSFTVLLLPCPGPWRLILGPESRALGSPGLCKVLQLHVLPASGRFIQQREILLMLNLMKRYPKLKKRLKFLQCVE